MGLFKKTPRLSRISILPKVRRSNYLEPPNMSGLLRTNFVSTLGNGHRVAYWVGVGEQVISQYEFEFDTQDLLLSVDADKELAFALGVNDECIIPVFTHTVGTSSRISLAWNPPVARSQEPVQERILREFALNEEPLGVINGILQKGLSLWTLTFTDSAIYALSEIGQQSKRIPWENLAEIRWNKFDLAFWEIQPTENDDSVLHEFFHIRFPHTWREFVVGLEEAWLRNGVMKEIIYEASGNRCIHFCLFSVRDKLFGQYLPVADCQHYQGLQAEGKVPEIENWLDTQRAKFRLERVQDAL